MNSSVMSVRRSDLLTAAVVSVRDLVLGFRRAPRLRGNLKGLRSPFDEMQPGAMLVLNLFD